MNLTVIRFFSICILLTFCMNISAQDNIMQKLASQAVVLITWEKQILNCSETQRSLTVLYCVTGLIPELRLELNGTKLKWYGQEILLETM